MLLFQFIIPFNIFLIASLALTYHHYRTLFAHLTICIAATKDSSSEKKNDHDAEHVLQELISYKMNLALVSAEIMTTRNFRIDI